MSLCKNDRKKYENVSVHFKCCELFLDIFSSYLLANFSGEVLQEVNDLLFDLWRHLISAGPGSSHLEMMDIIFKNQQFLLWKYMEVSAFLLVFNLIFVTTINAFHRADCLLLSFCMS